MASLLQLQALVFKSGQGPDVHVYIAHHGPGETALVQHIPSSHAALLNYGTIQGVTFCM